VEEAVVGMLAAQQKFPAQQQQGRRLWAKLPQEMQLAKHTLRQLIQPVLIQSM
jgi:hypothetical protein